MLIITEMLQDFDMALVFFFFFFNDTATTEIYTLSLHDALPIWSRRSFSYAVAWRSEECRCRRSEEHTSELQSLAYLVCRLLLEKKKKTNIYITKEKKKKNKTKKKKNKR